jgi:hypothetical protein
LATPGLEVSGTMEGTGIGTPCCKQQRGVGWDASSSRAEREKGVQTHGFTLHWTFLGVSCLWLVGLGNRWGFELTGQEKAREILTNAITVISMGPHSFLGGACRNVGYKRNVPIKKWYHSCMLPPSLPSKTIISVQIWLPTRGHCWVVERIIPACFFLACQQREMVSGGQPWTDYWQVYFQKKPHGKD